MYYSESAKERCNSGRDSSARPRKLAYLLTESSAIAKLVKEVFECGTDPVRAVDGECTRPAVKRVSPKWPEPSLTGENYGLQ